MGGQLALPRPTGEVEDQETDHYALLRTRDAPL